MSLTGLDAGARRRFPLSGPFRSSGGGLNLGLVLTGRAMRAHILQIYRGMDLHTREMVRGSAMALLLKLLGAGATFLLYVLIGRLLGADGAGVYFQALALVTVAAVLARVGLDQVVVRHVAVQSTGEDWGFRGGIYRQALGLVLTVSCLLALMLMAVGPGLGASLYGEPRLAGVLYWMALAVPALALSVLHAQFLQGLKRIRDAVWLLNVAVPVLALPLTALLAVVMGVAGAALAYSLACLLALASGIRLWRGGARRLSGPSRACPWPGLLRSGWPLFGVAVMQMVINSAGLLLLGIWSSSAEVGIFAAASRTALLIGFILTAVSAISAPQFAALHSQDQGGVLARLAARSGLLTATCAAPLLLLFLVAPEQVLGLFGPHFAAGGEVLFILALGEVVHLLAGPASYLLAMCGHERWLRNSLALCAVLNLGLSLALIPALGMVGAAWASAITVAVQHGLALALVWWKLGFFPIPGLGRRLLPMPAREGEVA